jgi:hypothetical protein
VTRLVQASGTVSFAGGDYRVGTEYRGRQVQVGVADGAGVIAVDGETIRTHPIRHDRSKEHGALGNPNGRPRRRTSAA